MIYETIPYGRRFHFLYALHEPKSNHVQFGVGYRSMNGLQVKHVETDRVHLLEVDRWLQESKDKTLELDAKAAETFLVPPVLDRDKKGEFMALIERVWKQAADPRVLRQIVRLDEQGRAFFAKYNRRRDAIEIGLERVTQGVSQLSSSAGLLDKATALALAARLHIGGLSFSLPPPMNWGDTTNDVNPTKFKAIAKLLVKLADAIWPETNDA